MWGAYSKAVRSCLGREEIAGKAIFWHNADAPKELSALINIPQNILAALVWVVA